MQLYIACTVGAAVYHTIIEYQAGRDLQGRLVQSPLATAHSRQDGSALCPAES